MEPYGVIIVDAHDLVRAGVSLILQAEDDLEVLAEASSAGDVAPLVADLGPDVLCLGTRFPDADGFDLARGLRERLGGRVAIALLGSARESGLAERAAAAGADAFVSTGWEPERITATIAAAGAIARQR